MDNSLDLSGLHDLAHLIRVVDMLGRVAVHQSSYCIILDQSNTQAIQKRAENAQMLLTGLEAVYAGIPHTFKEAVARGTATTLQYQVLGTYHATVLKLCASLAYPVHRSRQVQEPFCSCARSSIAASAKLAKAVIRAGRIQDMSPMMAWCLWVHARISFVDSYMARSEPSADFSAVLELLEAMSKTWALAGAFGSLGVIYTTCELSHALRQIYTRFAAREYCLEGAPRHEQPARGDFYSLSCRLRFG